MQVFEMAHDVGGVWHYTDAVEQDPMGKSLDHRVHSSMYESLRTNLPREVMAYDDMEFTGEFDDRYAHMRASLQAHVITHRSRGKRTFSSTATERNSGYHCVLFENIVVFPTKHKKSRIQNPDHRNSDIVFVSFVSPSLGSRPISNIVANSG